MLRFTRLLVAAVILMSLVFVGAPHGAQAQEERYIDIDLTNLTATAFDGESAVFTAPITSGAPGDETPAGTFFILNRVLSETMDSSTIGIPNDAADGYFLTGVPYTQYFTEGGNAIHGSYWTSESVFGNFNTSHGCVGMSEEDAAFFWDFADLGTRVEIHY